MSKPCIFSPCKRYRYTLWREVPHQFDAISAAASPDEEFRGRQYLMVIGLNPSTADDTQDDPTIRRCMDFARRWGFGELLMTNIFAWRDTKPDNMKLADDPIGDLNDKTLKEAATGAGMVLAAWGKHGAHRGRANAVMAMIQRLHALRLNKDGSPQHPLYIPGDTKPSLMSKLLAALK